MEFPEVERVVYKNNPLVEVLFQIRIPRLLELEQQLPVQFQNAARGEYPILESRIEQMVPVPPFAQVPIQALPISTIYDFWSQNRSWRISLGSQFFALTTTDYVDWDEFRERAESVIELVLQTYQIAVFSRIGLRYRSVISRNDLGLDQVPWRDLISAKVCGYLRELVGYEQEKADFLKYESQAQFVIAPGRGTLRTGLINKVESNEVGFLIDGDYFSDREKEASLNVGLEALDAFHSYAYRVFRWSIEDRLHQAMGPQEPPPA